MNTNLSMQTALGSMQVALNNEVIKSVMAMGCTDAEWDLLTGNKVWLGTDRVVVKRQLESLLYSTLDLIGIPHFQIPAEYCASVIAIYVSGCNRPAACHMLANCHKAEDLGKFDGSNTPVDGMEKVTAQQLFALVLIICSGEEISTLVRRFKDKTAEQIQLGYETGGVPNEKKKQQ